MRHFAGCRQDFLLAPGSEREAEAEKPVVQQEETVVPARDESVLIVGEESVVEAPAQPAVDK